ncbi:hypothetical protein [Actinoplanes sp. NPDC026623]|uniref:hypothetical protein n=1 Tax=Actinoplanes sp. NPDC026623 TaxID=3155610 RepID=UPI0033DE0ABF
MNLDAYLTREQVIMVTKVSPDTIKKWRARGWLTSDAAGGRRQLKVRRCSDGTLRYRLGDILEAERDTRMSGHSRRGAPRCRATGQRGRSHASAAVAGGARD